MTTNADNGPKMSPFRNYWVYSVGLAIVWVIVLLLVQATGDTQKAQTVLVLFLGFCIGWVSTTIARYVYPPPKHWLSNRD